MRFDGTELDRYAEALLCLARAADVMAQVEDQLAPMVELLQQRADIRAFLGDERIQTEGKRRALCEMFEQGLDPVLLHFALVLHARDRLTAFPEIAARFYEKVSLLRERASGELVSARPLSPEQLEAVAREAGRVLGRKLELRPRVDTSLLGGVRIQVGDFVVDGTLDHQLEQLRHQLRA